jgi:hypothetical protein
MANTIGVAPKGSSAYGSYVSKSDSQILYNNSARFNSSRSTCSGFRTDDKDKVPWRKLQHYEVGN